MSYSVVTIDIQDHIADVRLNRPDKMNALNLDLFQQIIDAGKEVSANKDVRAVVLSGNGPSFCAGIDVANLNDPAWVSDPFGEGRGGFYPNLYQAPGWVWRDCPVPVICAMQGVAFGGGLQIALGADVRIAAPDTKMSVMEIKWGLIPDMSASQTLRDLVRIDVAKELTFTGRMVEATEAAALGLITRVSDTPFEDAMAMAKQIVTRNPNAVSYGKYLYNSTWHSEEMAGLQAEERIQAKIVGSPNQTEAVMAQMQKRTANYAQRDFDSFDDISLD